jgi:hypothetical protein
LTTKSSLATFRARWRAALERTFTGRRLAGDTAGIVEPLELTGAEVGVIAAGTFTNPDLVADALANPELFYVNVHTTTCPGGAIRGQFA